MKKYISTWVELLPDSIGEDVVTDASITLYVGTTKEISKRFHQLDEAGIYEYGFCQKPIFKPDRMYGLWLDNNEGSMEVLNANTVLEYFVDDSFPFKES